MRHGRRLGRLCGCVVIALLPLSSVIRCLCCRVRTRERERERGESEVSS